jgi:hypothetical protein
MKGQLSRTVRKAGWWAAMPTWLPDYLADHAIILTNDSCSVLFSKDLTERVVFSSVDGLPYVRRTGFDRTLPGRVSDIPEVGNRYSSGL